MQMSVNMGFVGGRKLHPGIARTLANFSYVARFLYRPMTEKISSKRHIIIIAKYLNDIIAKYLIKRTEFHHFISYSLFLTPSHGQNL